MQKAEYRVLEQQCQIIIYDDNQPSITVRVIFLEGEGSVFREHAGTVRRPSSVAVPLRCCQNLLRLQPEGGRTREHFDWPSNDSISVEFV